MMNGEEKIKTAHSLYEAYRKGDIKTLTEFFTDDADWWCFGSEEIPFTGRYKSRNEITEFLQELCSHIEVRTFVPQEVINNGDEFVVIGREKVRIKSTGKIVNTKFVHAFTFKNDKITAVREYLNSTAISAGFRQNKRPVLAWLCL